MVVGGSPNPQSHRSVRPSIFRCVGGTDLTTAQYIAINAGNSDIRTLAHRRPKIVTISTGGPLHFGGTARSSPGVTNRLRLRIARRYAPDRWLESGRSFDWTPMTKAELIAENRPA